MLTGVDPPLDGALGTPCCLVAREKNRLAAAISLRLLKRKSTMRPAFIQGAIGDTIVRRAR